MASGIRRSEDLGGMGESFFRLVAKDAGLVANSSSDDKAGWDFELEEASPLAINYSDQSRPVYRVQVKATMSNKLSVGMSFSSLLSLIQYGGPAFVVLIQFGEDLIPRALHIAHIDEKRTIEILRDLRSKEILNKDIKLNKSKFILRFDATSSLTASGAELSKYLKGSINRNYLAYLDCKMKWLRDIEEDSKTLRVNMRFESAEGIRAMVDSMLGYETSLNTASITFKAPLGIPDLDLIHPTEYSPTTLKPVLDKLPRASVRLRTSPYGPIYEFTAAIYSVPMIFPNEFAAVRIHTALFDIVYRLQDQTVEFKISDLVDKDLEATASETRAFVEYIVNVSETKTTILEIAVEGHENTLKLSIETTGSLPADYYEVSAAAESLFSKLSALGLSGEIIRPADVFDKNRRNYFLQYVGKTYETPVSFEFTHDGKCNIDANVVLFIYPISLKDKTVLCFAAFYGKLKKIGAGKLYGTFTRSESLGEIIVPSGEGVENLQKLHGEKLEDLLRKRGHIVL
ncbi:hypothetical protein [Halopseudomonas laoshanensis]|uniref:hypothetical protein n=1 Tax=Halopseudomonas laoshanensis TaxID=2268758 RepID=UPI0037353857